MNPTLTIRPAEKSDVYVIARLMNGMGFNHSAEEIERRWIMADDRAQDHILLALENAHPVGLVCVHIAPLLFYPEPLARITTLVVDQTKRRQGIGRDLVREVISLAIENGCDTVELTTGLAREDAHAFYRSIGFYETARRMSLTV